MVVVRPWNLRLRTAIIGDGVIFFRMLRRGLILLALVLAFSLFLTGCRRRPVNPPINTEPSAEEAQPTEETASAPASGLSPELLLGTSQALKNETSRAIELAKELNNNLELVILSMTFENSFSDLQGLVSNYFIFATGNPSDPYYYIVNVPRDGRAPKRFIMLKRDFEFDYTVIAIPNERWKINYAQAINASEQKGGESFRARHPNFQATATLAMPVTQRLAWYVTYRALDGSGATFQTVVEAETGEATVLSQ